MPPCAIERRSSRRYSAKQLSYQASIAFADRRLDFKVLDFSATGIQIEMPVEIVIPCSGTLRFRDQPYQYFIRREISNRITKCLGLELAAIPLEQIAPEIQSDVSGWHFSGDKTRKWTVRRVLFYSVEVSLLGLAVLLLFGQSNSQQSFQLSNIWETASSLIFERDSKIVDSVESSNAATRSSIAEKSAAVNKTIDRARSFFDQGDYAQVVKLSGEAISLEGRNVQALRLRGIALDKLAQFDAAIDALRRALALNTSDPVIHEDLARVYLNAGQLTAAVKQGLRGIELADRETKPRFKSLLATAYEARATHRLKDDDAEGAQQDQIEATRWRQ